MAHFNFFLRYNSAPYIIIYIIKKVQKFIVIPPTWHGLFFTSFLQTMGLRLLGLLLVWYKRGLFPKKRYFNFLQIFYNFRLDTLFHAQGFCLV